MVVAMATFALEDSVIKLVSSVLPVGQILFLIADSSQVVPVQVFEEVIRTTLEGKEKTYIIKLPDKSL